MDLKERRRIVTERQEFGSRNQKKEERRSMLMCNEAKNSWERG